MNYTLAAEIDLNLWTRPSEGPNTSSMWICRKSVQFSGSRDIRRKPQFCPWWPWPLTFDLDIQTRPSEGPNTSYLWIWRKSIQRFWRY